MHDGESRPSVPAPRRPRRIVVAIILFLAVCGYLGFIRRYCSPYAGGSDQSGYLNTARLIQQGELVTTVPRIEGLTPPAWNYFYQQPLGFLVDHQRGTRTPTYPIGYSLHLLLAGSLVHLDYATIPVNIALVLAAAALTVALGRHFGLPWVWTFACAAVLWCSPLFVLFALQPMSDVAAMVWVLAAIWLALRSRAHWPWAFAAGLAVGIAVLVRPSNLLVVVPLAFALGWRVRAWLALVAGGLPAAVFLCWFNNALYGSPFETGYGSVASLFSIGYFPPNAAHIVAWLMLVLSPAVMLAALALPAVWRRLRFFTGLITLWSAAFAGFYVFYYYTGETWWYLRFILPAVPPVIVAAALVVFHLRDRWMPRLRWLPAVLLVFALTWEVALCLHLHLTWTKSSESAYKLTADWTSEHLPANAIVLQMQLSGAFAYYTDFTMVRWDLLERDTSWPLLQRAAHAANRPLYAVLQDFEVERAWPEHIPGNWKRVTQLRQMSVWELAPDREDAAPAGAAKS